MSDAVDIAIIGAGAAGLMAGIWAGRAGPGRRIVVLDSARKLGAKILVAGGGRCNVTHDQVDEIAFAGSSRKAIRKVLLRFDVPSVVEFFRELGVELKREETGKLFPTTDKASTVLDALLGAAGSAGVELRHPCRAEAVSRAGGRFAIAGPWGTLFATRVVLATGGRSLPKSGSDGHGLEIARSLGHTVTPRVLPALVPLTLPKDHFICALSGIATPATLEVRAGAGRKLASFTGSVLCTHFGLSGPAVLDVSRYFIHARLDDPSSQLAINWIPGQAVEDIDRMLLEKGAISPARALSVYMPERLARALCKHAGVDPSALGRSMTRERRQALAKAAGALVVPVTGDRGFVHAEVTAGGVPLSELRLESMESRVCPGLHLCGEICDVDGRIGGYNFQWAWSSGYVVGVSAGLRSAEAGLAAK